MFGARFAQLRIKSKKPHQGRQRREATTDIMTKILVILATNRQNLGMYSVDRAAVSFFRSLDVTASFQAVLDHRYLKKRYGKLPVLDFAGSFETYDVVVYWGDFTTSPWYGYHSFNSVLSRRNRVCRMTGKKISRKRGFQSWERLFSPVHVPKPCYSIGQNFQISLTNPQEEKFFHTMGFDCESHFKGFSSMLSRDSVSQAFLNEARGSREAFLCDLAFHGHRPATPKDRSVRKVGILLGRSKLHTAKTLEMLLRKKFEVVNFHDWLSANWISMDDAYEQAKIRIASCDLIITDVYHLSINSLSLGVPVICISTNDEAQFKAVSDFKKKILFRDLELDEAYISLSSPQTQARDIATMIDHKIKNIYDVYTMNWWLTLAKKISDSRKLIIRELGI